MSENAILMIERFFRSRWIVDRYRNERSKLAEARVGCVCDDPTKIVIGLGGGMLGRSHPALINLNIKQFDDVDLVADAHRIPLRDQSVDGVHCGAVFEHFQDPQEAAAELFRVMKPGALGFIVTPFLQCFHGYPSHFQNFTEIGHQRLFERAGFRILESGVCGGPALALANIVLGFISCYSPARLRKPFLAIWFPIGVFMIKPLDRWLIRSEKAHVFAATTYVLIER